MHIFICDSRAARHASLRPATHPTSNQRQPSEPSCFIVPCRVELFCSARRRTSFLDAVSYASVCALLRAGMN